MKRPTKLAVRAMSDLGLSPQWWNEGKLKAMQQLGRYLDMELTVQMLIVRGFSTLEQAEKACQLLNALASDPKNSVDDRAFAASMIPKAVDAFRMLSEQIVSESERLPKNIKVLPAPPPPPPMNLPPQVNVQVVTGGGSSPPPLLPSPLPMEQHALPPAIPDSQPIDVESSPE